MRFSDKRIELAGSLWIIRCSGNGKPWLVDIDSGGNLTKPAESVTKSGKEEQRRIKKNKEEICNAKASGSQPAWGFFCFNHNPSGQSEQIKKPGYVRGHSQPGSRMLLWTLCFVRTSAKAVLSKISQLACLAATNSSGRQTTTGFSRIHTTQTF